MSLTFQDANTRAVVTLLGACVMADREDRDSELTEFCHSAQLLTRYVSPETIYSRAQLIDWFRQHRDALSALSQDTTRFTAMLEEITDPELRRRMLAAMFAIFVCDYELADEENALLRLTLSAWREDGRDVQTARTLDDAQLELLD